MQSQSCFQDHLILSKLSNAHTKITKTTRAFWYPGAICLNGNSDFWHNVFDLLFSFICSLSITERRNFRKQYDKPIAFKQRALKRRLWEHLTFYITIPFTNVERFRQKCVYTGWKLKTKVLSWEIHTQTQTHIHTHTHLDAHTNTHHQQACGSTKSVWRCSDVKDMSAGIHLNNSHTHNLSLLPLCWLYSYVCVTTYISTTSWIIHLLTITVFHTST